MGGLCFVKAKGTDQQGLFVPRMPSALYNALKGYTILRLQEVFEHVTVPAECPEKSSFGDIDFLVAGCKVPIDLPNEHTQLASTLRSYLAATRVEFQPTNRTISLAISYELFLTDFRHEPHCLREHLPACNQDLSKVYVQVDVHVCPSSEIFRYMIFHHGYGDACNILAVALQPLGLTFVPTGLALNLNHIASNVKGKPRRMILSTSVPDVMEFLGLNEESWYRGFATKDDLFRWIIGGRFSGHLMHRDFAKQTRMKKRPIFEEFLTSWLPKHISELPEPRWSRHAVLEEAVTRFDKRIELDSVLEEQAMLEKEKQFWEAVKIVIPQESKQGKQAIKGLRRWVAMAETDGGCGPVLREEPEMAQYGQPLWTRDSVWTKDALLAWVTEHWRDIACLERLREKEAEWLRRRRKETGG